MSFVEMLRKFRLLPAKKVSEEDVAQAVTENALRDNEKAFCEMHQVSSMTPETNEHLRRSIKSAAPLADLERIMRGEKRIRH